jgi:Spy/CpxP family protein refolding chaperone
MKNKIPVLVSVLGLAVLAGLSIAATSTPPTPAPATTGPDNPRDEFRARLVEKLGLSADQQKKIDELRARQRTELQALNDNNALTPEARREQGRALVENYRVQMHAVLTPDQQKKVDEWRARWALNPHDAGSGHRPGSADRRGPAMAPPANPLAIVAMADRIKDRMAEKLQLTDEQRDKLEHLGRAYRAQQRDLAQKHMEEMRAVLTPEQQKKAEEMKQHFRPGSGVRPGRDGQHPPLVSMDDEPIGPLMAGMDFGPVGPPEAMPDDLPPLPDTN